MQQAERGLVRWRFSRNLGILATGEILARGCTFIAFAQFARVLEPAGYGQVEIAVAVAMFLTLLIEQGLKTLGACLVARDPAASSSIVSQVISAQLILAIVIVTVFALVVLSLPVAATLRILLLGFGLTTLGVPFLLHWFFQGRELMHWVALPQLLRQAVFASLALLIVRSPSDAWRLPIAEGVGMLVAVTLNLAAYRGLGARIVLRFRAIVSSRIVLDSLPIGCSQMIWAFRMYLPIVVLGLVSADSTVGLFGSVHRIVMVFIAALTIYFMNLLPAVSQAAAAPNGRLAELLARSLRVVGWSSVGLAVAVAWLAPRITEWVFGTQYLVPESIQAFRVLVWLVPVEAWRRHGWQSLIALGKQGAELSCSAIGVVALALIVIPLAKTSGAAGAAWAMLLSEMLATVLIWAALKPLVPALRLRNCLIPSSGRLLERGASQHPLALERRSH